MILYQMSLWSILCAQHSIDSFDSLGESDFFHFPFDESDNVIQFVVLYNLLGLSVDGSTLENTHKEEEEEEGNAKQRKNTRKEETKQR